MLFVDYNQSGLWPIFLPINDLNFSEMGALIRSQFLIGPPGKFQPVSMARDQCIARRAQNNNYRSCIAVI